jgi:hypothetical protein
MPDKCLICGCKIHEGDPAFSVIINLEGDPSTLLAECHEDCENLFDERIGGVLTSNYMTVSLA